MPSDTTPNSELQQRVEQVETQLARLIDIVANRLTPPSPTAGSDGADGDDQPPLEEWVDEIIERYYLRGQLRGWQKNTAIRAELEGLRSAHTAAWSADAGPWEQTSWHDAFARFLHRVSRDVSYPRDRAEDQPPRQPTSATAAPASTTDQKDNP